MSHLARVLAVALFGIATAASALAELPATIRIGVLNDMSGPFADLSGPNSVVAARLAADDFLVETPGAMVEIVSADHQNKPDVGSAIVRRWIDVDDVAAVVDVPNSAVGLAVNDIMRQKNRVFLASSVATSDLSGPACQPTTVQWTVDTWALTNGAATPLIRDGGDSWFLIASDFALGRALERDVGALLRASGAALRGTTFVPLNSADFSASLIQAQASGAKIVALAMAGNDAIGAIKQAAEFGLARSGRQRLAGLLLFITDIDALGLEAAQGLLLTEAFYWDLTDATRAWSRRFAARAGGRMPSANHAGVYSATLAYLRAARDANTVAGRAVVERMRAAPIEDALFGRSILRVDGRVTHAMYLFQVKRPDQSRGRWDDYNVVATIPAEQAFRPLDASCPLVAKQLKQASKLQEDDVVDSSLALPIRFDPFSPEYLADPYPTLAVAREAAPVFHDAELDLWVVTRHHDIRHIFRTPSLFSAINANSPLRPVCPMAARALADGGWDAIPTLTNVDPPAHTRVRKLANVAFTPRRVAEMEPFIRGLAVRFCEERFRDGRADIVADLAWELPALVLFRILGVPAAEVPRIKDGSWSRILFVYGHPGEAEQIEAAHGMAAFWRYAEELVEARRADPHDDFTSALVHARDPDGIGLTTRQAATIVLNLLFAGHETTTGLLGNVFRRLLESPADWRAVCDDPSLIPGAAEEVLRLDSSVIAWRRRTTAPVEIGGVPVPGGADLLLMLGSANRDPAVFPGPDRFDIRRANARDNLSLGIGPHLCLGGPLARLQARVVVEEVARRLPGLRLAPGVALLFAPNVSFRGPLSLPVTWEA